MLYRVIFLYVLLYLIINVSVVNSATTAKYADLEYDIVYIRCPRGNSPVNWMGEELLDNWNGVNDMWLSASNNIYHQPGCDLMLHQSNVSPEVTDRRSNEKVLIECDENDTVGPICTVADPNISLDGKKIVYTKFSDTRKFLRGGNNLNNGGSGSRPHHNFAHDVDENLTLHCLNY